MINDFSPLTPSFLFNLFPLTSCNNRYAIFVTLIKVAYLLPSDGAGIVFLIRYVVMPHSAFTVTTIIHISFSV